MLLDIQAEILSDLNTRVVVPLLSQDLAGLEREVRLHPLLTVGDTDYVMMTTHLGAVPVSDLGSIVANVEVQRQTVIDAIDFLLQGF